MKKLTSIFLSAIILFCIFACGAASASAKKSGEFEYEVLKDGTAEIIAYLGKSDTITIPDKIGKYTVTSMGWYWLDEKKVKVLNIPATITKIDREAFLASQEVNIDENNPKYKSIDGVVFSKNGTKLIQFPYKKNKNSVYTVPDGVQVIGDSAFRGAYLKGVELPDSVNRIEQSAFQGCEELESIVIPDKVTTLEMWSFSNCASLKSVVLSKNLKKIVTYCFEWCSSLKSITFPEGLERIENEAFSNTAISSLKLPKTLKYLSGFEGINIKSVEIPSSVETLGDNCFAYCNKLKSVKLHKGLKKIGDCVFFYCGALKSLKIPSTVTELEGDPFTESGIKELTLPKSLKKLDIGKSTFGVFPKTLKKLSISKSNKYFTTKNGLLYNKKKTKFLYYPSKHKQKTFKLPESVKSIGGNAFSGADIKKVVVGKKLKKVDKNAFNNAYIKTLEFMKGVKKIGKGSFYFSQVYRVKLPNTVTRIEDEAFYASSLCKINIPKSVKYIGKEAFFGAELGKITIPPTVKKIGRDAIGILYGECGSNGGVNKNTVIRCKKDSAAHKYARKYKVKFELM